MMNTLENREKLAIRIVEDMDMDDLMEALADRLVGDFKYDNEVFEMEWEDYFE